ncbi:hypothetical protein I317_00368 [Kwoniella heveanensis CBS 569]|nr:hypothetical protein I317_00368 [Kwoniella heveanensis CBS 569]
MSSSHLGGVEAGAIDFSASPIKADGFDDGQVSEQGDGNPRESGEELEKKAEPVVEVRTDGENATDTTIGDEGQGAGEGNKRKSLREKPSPISLPTDLLNPHEADSLHPPDSPTTSLISSLRAQLTLLSDQSVALNQKLIASIGRSADLEDELHDLQSRHQNLETRAKGLQGEKERWEESMNTGLLVERSQIKDEMQRLAAGLVEEERRRGSAEERREQVESEVDELTAKLFDQANTMVAAERMSRAEAEARLKTTEDNLAAAEAAVRDMQLHLQSLAPSSAQPASATDSALTPHSSAGHAALTRRYISSHVPYFEFISFLTHIRALRPLKETSKNTFPQPLITNLLAQPFLARAVTEDHEPTLRLEAAPDLSWLSRRSVGSAIISGDLIIEPVSAATLLASTSSAMHDIGCSLCGKPIFSQAVPQSPAGSHFSPPPLHPQRGTTATASSSRFSLKPFFNSASSTAITGSPNAPAFVSAPSPAQSPITSPAIGTTGQVTSVYIFRIAKPQVQAGQAEKGDSKLYPLCRSGWCLERMRATCELWHFVRTSVIHVVWHGDDGTASTRTNTTNNREVSESGSVTKIDTVDEEPTASASTSISETAPLTQSKLPIEPPPLPQRKKSGWALGFKLSDKSTGGWTRGWKTASNTNSPPVSPGGAPGHGIGHRNSVGSLGAENDDVQGPVPGSTTTTEGLGLGAALDIDEKKVEPVPGILREEAGTLTASESEEKVPKIDEPLSSEAESKQTGDSAAEEKHGLEKDDATLHPEAPVLSRAGSNISIPLSTATTDDAHFSTPKGDHADLPSEDGHQPADSVDRDALNTPQPPRGEQVVELASPKLDTGTGEAIDTPQTPSRGQAKEPEDTNPIPTPTTPGGSKVPPPIPRRAAARNRLSQLNTPGGSPGSSSTPAVTAADEKKDDQGGDGDDGVDLSALQELADELDGKGDVTDGREASEQEGESELALGDDNDAPAGNDGAAGVGPDSTTTDKLSEPELAPARGEKARIDIRDEKEKDQDKDGDEEPFTPVNLDEKFPPSPGFPPPPHHPSAGGVGAVSSSRPASTSSTIAPAHAPPLPPRHPKTPTMGLQVHSANGPNDNHSNNPTGSAEGEKRFLAGRDEGWEAKTWKSVIRLKEEMFKARVGVMDQ